MTRKPLSPGQLNHIALPTLDPSLAEKFYVELLGFRVVPRPSFSFDGRWLYRERVGPMIHLIHVPTHQVPRGPIRTLGSHFAIQCEDTDAVVDELTLRGIEFVERSLPDYGYRQIFFRDPDGNLIELGSWPDIHDMVCQHEREAEESSSTAKDQGDT